MLFLDWIYILGNNLEKHIFDDFCHFEGAVQDSPLPNDWDDFLKNSTNKNTFNEFLTCKFMEIHSGSRALVCSYKDTVLFYPSTEPMYFSDITITDCTSEEADQRLIRHALHCVSTCYSYKIIVVRTVDTDVLALLISYISQNVQLISDIDIYIYMQN